jgi:diacylglycerol O-acyltransferase
MKAVEPNDHLFLLMERRQQPMHVAGLQLFSLPEGEDLAWTKGLVEHARSHNRPVAPFNKHLLPRFGMPFWAEDTELDIDLHVRHWALPQPGRIRELLSLVSAEHSVVLDRERPMWECHVIEGLSGGRFAIYTKVHHALMDGISLMRLGMGSLSTDPDERDMPPFWARKKKRNIRSADASAAYYAALSARYLRAFPKVAAEALKMSVRARMAAESMSLFRAPRSVLNGKITGSRRVAAQSYDLERVRLLARAAGATVNDVVLAICAGALRRYLVVQGALPSRPLVAMVPMSLRKDDSLGGNMFALILANLGTHLSDPEKRLRVITDSVREAKRRYLSMSIEEAGAMAAMILAPFMMSMATGVTPGLLPFNVVISNVPGPREPLYWNGARLEGVYPMSIVLDHNALNITLTSYRDSLEFGVVGCRRSLPSMQRLLKDIASSLDELESALGLAPYAGAPHAPLAMSEALNA